MPTAPLVLVMLLCSNSFMTLAWYGHLRFSHKPAVDRDPRLVGNRAGRILLRRPANRIGFAGGLSGGQLKIMQECVTLVVFAVFAMLVLNEPLTWRYAGAFALHPGRRGLHVRGQIAAGVAFNRSKAPSGSLSPVGRGLSCPDPF